MHFLLKLSRHMDRISEWIGQKIMWLVLVTVLISAVNAITRKFFHLSSNAWLEIQWYLFASLFMLAAGYTFLRNEHVRIDVLSSRLSARAQNWIDLFGIVFFLLPVCGLIFWLALPIVGNSIASGEGSPNPGGLIRWPVKLMLPLGLALLILQALSELVKRIAFLRGLMPNPLEKPDPAAASSAGKESA